jgi:hypothetical protein
MTVSRADLTRKAPNTAASDNAAEERDVGAADNENLQVGAEARGFEPRMGLKSQTALAVRRHRPD